MKYHIANAIACTVGWIDDVLLDHGERFESVPLIWRIPSCEWSGRLGFWAARQCCESNPGCARCNEDFGLTADEIRVKWGIYDD